MLIAPLPCLRPKTRPAHDLRSSTAPSAARTNRVGPRRLARDVLSTHTEDTPVPVIDEFTRTAPAMGFERLLNAEQDRLAPWDVRVRRDATTRRLKGMDAGGPSKRRASGAATLLCWTLLARSLSAAECGGEASSSDECSPTLPTLGTQNPVAEVQSFGVAGTLTRGRFEEQSPKGASVLASAAHFSYDTRTVFNGRSYGFGFIGGGSAGFEAGLGGELAFGLRIPLAKAHGPFVRIAVEGFIMGNDRFYASMLELPKGEFGYQLLDKSALVEAAVTAGPVLTGQFDVEGAERRALGGLFEVGGHVALGLRTVHLEFTVNRLDSGDFRLGAFNALSGSLCALPSFFAVCADARYLAGGANDPEPDARVAYFGVRAGVVTSSAPARRSGRTRQTVPP